MSQVRPFIYYNHCVELDMRSPIPLIYVADYFGNVTYFRVTLIISFVLDSRSRSLFDIPRADKGHDTWHMYFCM
jgi:hypothetical protein